MAKEYGVAPRTIDTDAEFTEALDTLEEQVKRDIRQAILKRKDKGRVRVQPPTP